MILSKNFSTAVQYVKDAISPSTRLFVTLNSHSYWEGDIVQGTVNVISEAVPYTAEIIVKLKGISLGDKPDSIINDTKYIAEELHLKQETVIFTDVITESHQIFPFEFSLPQVCPGSFNYEHGVAVGKVHYCVEAISKVQSRKIKKAKSAFNVYEKCLQAVPIRALHEINHITLSVWLERNVYFPGDSMLVRLKINNEANSMTREMRISLMHVARYRGAPKDDENIGLPNIICSQQITAAAPYYYGIKWIPFAIPKKLPLLSSSHGSIVSCFFIQIDDFAATRKLTVPVTILAKQHLNSLHPLAPPGVIPPPAQIRPPLQLEEETKCNLCEAPFGMLKFMSSHCRHCGKIFCANCANTTTRVPKLGLHDPVKVCRTCKRIIEETGGVAYQLPKQVITEWAQELALTKENIDYQIKKSNKEFKWTMVATYDNFTVCYQAVP